VGIAKSHDSTTMLMLYRQYMLHYGSTPLEEVLRFYSTKREGERAMDSNRSAAAMVGPVVQLRFSVMLPLLFLDSVCFGSLAFRRL
jgi:hypothetical protein